MIFFMYMYTDESREEGSGDFHIVPLVPAATIVAVQSDC